MSIERTPRMLPQYEFARQLGTLAADPHGSVIAMETALEISIGGWLGFRSDLSARPEEFRQQRLSLRQYEAIKGLEEMSVLLSAHGTVPPGVLGSWLLADNPDFNSVYPMKLMFGDFADDGLNPDDVRRVAEVYPYLSTDPHARLALGDLMRR